MPTVAHPSPFGQRLKQARLLRGLSLRDLSAKLTPSVSHVSLAKYENGSVKASGDLVASLCAALQVPPDFLFRPIRVQLENVSFRKRKSFGAKATDALLEEVRRQLENYLEAEEIVGDRSEFENPVGDFPDRGDANAVRQLAKKLRAKWGLGSEPIPSLTQLLESKGIRVIEVDEPSQSFDGCQVGGFHAIAIGKRAKQPVTRKRFTIAHEFAHVVLNDWGNQLGLDEKALEKVLINPFASEFLMPSDALRTYFGGSRTVITERELVSVKRKFGVSISAIVRGLHDVGIIGANVYKRFYFNILPKWRKDDGVVEPGDEGLNFVFQEYPLRFERIVLRGLSEGSLSISRAAGLLDRDIVGLRKLAIPCVE